MYWFSSSFCVFLLIEKWEKILVSSLHIAIKLYYWFIYVARMMPGHVTRSYHYQVRIIATIVLS